MKVSVSIALDLEMLDRIERARGKESRSAFVCRAVEKALGSGVASEPRQGKGSVLAKAASPPVSSRRPDRQARTDVARKVIEGESVPLPAIAPRRWAQ